MDNKFIKAFDLIKQANSILLVTHYRPDGDALASVCAMMEVLNRLGKPYTAYCFDQPPPQYNFLPRIEEITWQRENFNFNDFDLIIPLDCGSMDRTKLTEEIKNKTRRPLIIEFDHHPKIDDYADVELRDPASSSTAEMIYRFCQANSIKINKPIANCILTGIVTDTGNFLYSATTGQTVQIASEMLSRGARFPRIMEHTWRNKSLSAMKLWGQAINNLAINKRYNLAVSVLPYAELSQSNASEEELEGMAGFLSNLYGVNGLLLLREESPGAIKGSLRTSRDQVDISLLAQFLGGGGHAKASAFTLAGGIKKDNKHWEIK